MIGAQCLKHRVLGIAHFILSPYLCSGIKNKKNENDDNNYSHGDAGTDEPHL